MDKRAVVQMVVEQITMELDGIISAAKATHEEATHEQNKPENKYDTRALEASYLAQGQSRQIAELRRAQQEFDALRLAESHPHAPIDVGALLALKQGANEIFYLLGPRAGGIEIVFEGKTVTVITPQSPIGRQLIGKVQGDSVTLPNDPKQKPLKIASVW
jgi:transcription elongation GreA/GreB family factor